MCCFSISFLNTTARNPVLVQLNKLDDFGFQALRRWHLVAPCAQNPWNVAIALAACVKAVSVGDCENGLAPTIHSTGRTANTAKPNFPRTYAALPSPADLQNCPVVLPCRI
jgi:hypothetical protein